MRTRLRLALPPLAELGTHSDMAFALYDRAGRLLRSGRLPLSNIATAVGKVDVHAILHPRDAIVVTIDIPPVPVKRLHAAVQARVEPMTLSEIDDLHIAHGPRSDAGKVDVAWADRRALDSAWRVLDDAGLRIAAIVPFSLAIPAGEPPSPEPLDLPADGRWNAPLPKWSFARPEWRSASHQRRWRNGLVWAGAAALVWIIGVNIHAAQLRREMRAVQQSMEDAVRAAFPALPVIIDPLRQARGQRDMLRQSNGSLAADDFVPLALGAAKVLSFAEGHVAAIQYQGGKLSLKLADGYTPPSNETVLHQAAAVQSFILQKDEAEANTWHVSRNAAAANPGATR